MQVQVVLFKNRDGIIPRLIQFQSDSPYCHAALLFNGKYLIEAVARKGVIGREITQLPDYADVFDIPALDNEAAAVIYEFAKAQVGKGYDYWGVLRFISRRRLPENDRWFCSELVAEAFEVAERPLLNNIKTWQYEPGKLAYSPYLFLRKK